VPSRRSPPEFSFHRTVIEGFAVPEEEQIDATAAAEPAAEAAPTPVAEPELTPRQLEALRAKLRRKYH
jgi:hypothetical protein